MVILKQQADGQYLIRVVFKGSNEEKGTITGIIRSLGALARSLGPIFSSLGKSNVIK